MTKIAKCSRFPKRLAHFAFFTHYRFDHCTSNNGNPREWVKWCWSNLARWRTVMRSMSRACRLNHSRWHRKYFVYRCRTARYVYGRFWRVFDRGLLIIKPVTKSTLRLSLSAYSGEFQLRSLTRRRLTVYLCLQLCRCSFATFAWRLTVL